ncbi:MAG TPA: hypothetical protein PK711_10120 [Bacteroidales bacterium]|nr:hypothetical protein [Bacteroidales bacterium]
MKINELYREICQSLSKVEVIEFRRKLKQISSELKREHDLTEPPREDS